MMYTDAHTHLNSDELFPDRKTHLSDFIAIGGVGLINVGVDKLWNQRAITIAQESESLFGATCIVKATVGGHPSEVCFGQVRTRDDISEYKQHIQGCIDTYPSYIVGIGECGIDAHYDGYTPIQERLQQEFFEMQCELARRHNLPIVIHSRDAYDATKEVLQQFKDLSIYMHCRGYASEQIRDMILLFPKIWFGFCGNITYPKAEGVRTSFLEVIDHERYKNNEVGLLVETDAPWLSPQLRRGKQHAPAFIDEQYTYAAGVASMSCDSFQERVFSDWKRLYRVL